MRSSPFSMTPLQRWDSVDEAPEYSPSADSIREASLHLDDASSQGSPSSRLPSQSSVPSAGEAYTSLSESCICGQTLQSDLIRGWGWG